MHIDVARGIVNVSALSLVLAACGPNVTTQSSPQSEFWATLSDLCGSAFEGRLTEGSEGARASFGTQYMVMHVRDCTNDEIRIPFHVGENRSRTWIITRLEDGGLRLKHDHRHEDGSPDAITFYGGDTATEGTESTQEFPADAESVAMFAQGAEEEPGLVGAEFNLWTVELRPGDVFAYQLTRTNDSGTRFRVEFDLTESVAVPPAAWGHE